MDINDKVQVRDLRNGVSLGSGVIIEVASSDKVTPYRVRLDRPYYAGTLRRNDYRCTPGETLAAIWCGTDEVSPAS